MEVEDKLDFDENEEPPKVELTAEEKKVWFHKGIPDLTPYMLSTSFTKYSLPEKDEGFGDIRYEWQKAPKCAEHLKEYKLEKKIMLRMEELVPGEWFRQEADKFQRATSLWHAKMNDWKNLVAKRASAAQAKAKKKADAEAAAKAKAEAEAKAKEEAEAAAKAKEEAGETKEGEASEEKKEEKEPRRKRKSLRKKRRK